MTFAWENTKEAKTPTRWNMRRVLTIATVLSATGVVASFLLYWFLRDGLEYSTPVIQTMIFLKLLVAGHLTIFLTRTRSWFWTKPWPSLSLFLALERTQILGTLVAVYGVLVEPIG